MPKILLIEDDPRLAATLANFLVVQGHECAIAAEGDGPLASIAAFGPELIILDHDLMQVSGIDVVRTYRERQGAALVLLLLSESGLSRVNAALQCGADDYLIKPSNPRALMARLNALLRRPALNYSTVLSFGEVTLDPLAKRVTKSGVEVWLQPMELSILEFFMRHPNQVFSPNRLLSMIWGSQESLSEEAVYTCIRRIRQKLDPDGDTLLKTVRGAGYRMDSNDSA